MRKLLSVLIILLLTTCAFAQEEEEEILQPFPKPPGMGRIATSAGGFTLGQAAPRGSKVSYPSPKVNDRLVRGGDPLMSAAKSGAKISVYKTRQGKTEFTVYSMAGKIVGIDAVGSTLVPKRSSISKLLTKSWGAPTITRGDNMLFDGRNGFVSVVIDNGSGMFKYSLRLKDIP
jgi:hypothetical protein